MKHLRSGCADSGALELAGARLDVHGIRISWRAIAGWTGAATTVAGGVMSCVLWFNGVFADFRHVKEATTANTAAIGKQTEEIGHLSAAVEAMRIVLLRDRTPTQRADARP